VSCDALYGCGVIGRRRGVQVEVYRQPVGFGEIYGSVCSVPPEGGWFFGGCNAMRLKSIRMRRTAPQWLVANAEFYRDSGMVSEVNMLSFARKPRSKKLNAYRSVLELRGHSKGKKASMSQKDIRSAVKIAIIDDEKFKAHANLTNYGYKIEELPDVKNLEQLEGFDVVLCDLMGVGQHFDHAIGGASIIKEVKENYPTKFIIAYTGARANTVEATVAKQYADDFLKKDDDIRKWVSKLDDAISFASDPYERWLVTRQSLIDLEVDLREIIVIESAYVEAVTSNDKEFSEMREIVKKADIGGNAKGVLQSLVASGIWALAFAA